MSPQLTLATKLQFNSVIPHSKIQFSLKQLRKFYIKWYCISIFILKTRPTPCFAASRNLWPSCWRTFQTHCTFPTYASWNVITWRSYARAWNVALQIIFSDWFPGAWCVGSHRYCNTALFVSDQRNRLHRLRLSMCTGEDPLPLPTSTQIKKYLHQCTNVTVDTCKEMLQRHELNY